MKILLTTYTFNAAAKQITLNYPSQLVLEQILLITNVTRNTIIYNFASTGGSISNNVLTLTYDTSAQVNSDRLLIYLDDADNQTATLQEISTQTVLLRRLIKISEALATADTQQRQRITLDAITSGLTLSTVTTVGTVSTVTSVTTVSTVTTVATVTNVANITAANISTLGNVPTIENEIQWSRTAYGAAIRPNLVFS